MLRIEEVANQEEWDSFLVRQDHANILQCWAWGQFQRELGRKVWNLGVYNENELVGVGLAQFIPTLLRSHIYLSNGPVILPQYIEEGTKKLLGYLKALGIKEKAKFIRIDPLIEDTPENNKLLKSMKLIKANTHVQAERKWLLDISKDEETLLKEMEKNTRYEIKKSEKEGIQSFSSSLQEDYSKFEGVFKETLKRQKFIPHPFSYYKTQFEVMSKYDNYKVVWSQKDNQIISAALIGYFGDSAFYLHAGSLNNREVNKLMGPQAVVWHALKVAKQQGMKYFDFWGIATTDDPKDPWAGFTRFKKGFGGYLFHTIRAYDLPIQPEYYAISLLEKFREVWGIPYYLIKKLLKH